MVSHLPDSELLDVREYLYVDAPRVRNLLAQFEAGLPEHDETKHTRSRSLTAAIATIIGLQSSTGHEEQLTRTLSDVHVSMLEEAATALGTLRDISEEVLLPKVWNRGKVAQALREGSLIRVTASTQLIDPTAIAATFRTMDDVTESHPDFSRNVTRAVEALYGEALALRIMPCGEEEPDCAFIGQVIDKSDYLGAERKALFSRLGGSAAEWTTLAQVSRIPASKSTRASWRSATERLMAELSTPENINRAMFEKFLVSVMDELEAHGLQAAPRHPEISVIPLAIYRPVLPTDEISALHDE